MPHRYRAGDGFSGSGYRVTIKQPLGHPDQTMYRVTFEFESGNAFEALTDQRFLENLE